MRLFGLLAASFAGHVVLLALLTRAPQPLPGIELAAISVEIVFADTVAAISAPDPRPAPNEQETQLQPDPNQSPPDSQRFQEAERTPSEREALEQINPTPQPSGPPEQDERPEMQTAPEPAVAQPDTKPIEQKASPGPPPKQKRRMDDAAAKHRPGVEQKAEPGAKPKGSSAAARAQTTADPNYYGIVAAHLARYKQFPAEARNNHSQGVATISFSIDGAGHVTAVRLARATGITSLDHEAQAMPRRASPFPTPPGGHAMSFTVPVSFVIR